MKFQEVEYNYSWTDNTEWRLPADEQLYQSELPKVDGNVKRVLAVTPGREICIQAGGCIGLWPIRYSQDFDRVITFEPLPISYSCLVENIRRCGITNITTYNTAIGIRDTKFKMRYPKHPNQGRSYGAHCIFETADGIAATSIDDIPLKGKVSHIQLDVEGYELKCLQSGENVIEEYRPSIVIEQRTLSHMQNYGATLNSAENWLKERGYYEADRFSGDILLVPK